ncbi:MAG: SLC13 family permease [Anaerolineae bacterium]
MTGTIAFVLAVLFAAAILFITEKLRPDLVALLVLTVFGVSGILTPTEALSGFSRPAVITILAIFILTAALEKTGVTRTLGAWLVRLGGRAEGQMLVVLMLSGALLSLFMNNIAAGAVLLPVAVGIASERKISPGKLMMPLAFGTLLGGMATLLTTVNILVSSSLRDNGLPGFELLDFLPIGIPAVLVGVVYMLLLGRRLLPRRAPSDWQRLMQAARGPLEDIYGLRERWMHALVPVTSPLVGRTLAQAGLGRELGVNVIAIIEDGKSRLAPPPGEYLHAGDLLFMQARSEQVELLTRRGLEIQSASGVLNPLNSESIGLFELALAPRSGALGKTVRDIHFREKYGLSVVAIWREGRPRRVGVGEMPLQQGDALLVLGPRQGIHVLQSEPEFIVLSGESDQPLRRSKGLWVVAIMAAAMVLSALGVLQIAEAMLAGALGMVLVGALTMDEAYQAIEWKVIFLIAGMLPAGVAMIKTGTAALVANLIVAALGAWTPLVVLAGLMVVALVLTQVMSGQATIVILAPIAISAAQQVHADARTFSLGVALACSMAFLTPLGHPVNILVMGPGGYKFGDYFRVGLLLCLLLLATFLLLLPLEYGL